MEGEDLVRKQMNFVPDQLQILEDNKRAYGFADLVNFMRFINQRFIEEKGLKKKGA